jgi:hypothetical protein
MLYASQFDIKKDKTPDSFIVKKEDAPSKMYPSNCKTII